MISTRRAFLGILAGLAATPAVAARLLRPDPMAECVRVLEAIAATLGEDIPPASGGFQVPEEFVEDIIEELDRHYVARVLR